MSSATPILKMSPLQRTQCKVSETHTLFFLGITPELAAGGLAVNAAGPFEHLPRVFTICPGLQSACDT